MKDWNNDGKIDNKDQMMDYLIFEESCNENTNAHTGSSGGGVFKVTLIFIVILILLALILGVGVPGEVLGFFIKVLLIVGFFTLLSR
jgi:hypothetical protein